MRKLYAMITIIFLLSVLAAPASAQIPVPTPTLLPAGNFDLMPDVNVTGEDISLWKMAPNAIQTWNMSNRDNVMTFYQVAVFFVILGTGIMSIYRVVTRAANSDA